MSGSPFCSADGAARRLSDTKDVQAMGLVNDHAETCVIRAKVARAREAFKRPGS
jgi:hypothetical protein